MLSLVDQDLVVVWYGRYQVLTGMSLGFYECDFFPEEILIRYMLFYISVVFLESCVGSGLCGSVSLINIYLLGGCTCSIGTSRWYMSVCSMILFPVFCVLLLPGG